ncbi:MAG: hypothetical protein U5N53_00095 [Mycobacterium sp.]|nr:hypothetical protein [Mycobacterium sp.]
MIHPKRSLASSGGSALCTCILAASLIAAPGVPGPPPSTPPTVQLTAAAKPLNIDVPELIAHIPEFAELVEPVAGQDDAPPAATAALARPGSIGIEIANAMLWLPAQIFKAIMNPALSPILTAPVIGPVLNGVLFATVLVSAGLAGLVGTVIMAIESAVWTVVEGIGAAVGGIFRLPAAALSGATAAAAPAAALRTAAAPGIEAGRLDTDTEPLGATSPLADDAVAGEDAPVDEITRDADTAAEATTRDEDEPAPPAAEPDERPSEEFGGDAQEFGGNADEETVTDEHDPTAEPPSQREDETEDADPAPTSPSADPKPADRDDSTASDQT